MTAEEVKRLQVGEAVKLCGDGGESVSCIVAGNGGKKFLTYRDKGQIKRFAIRDYPGKIYEREQNNGKRDLSQQSIHRPPPLC